MQQMSKWLFHHLSEGKAHNVIKISVQIKGKKIIYTYLMLSLYTYILYIDIYLVLKDLIYFLVFYV